MVIKKEKVAETFVFLVPTLCLYLVFFIIPLAGSIAYSFTDWDGIQKSFHIIGFKNYINIFKADARFINSILFTLKYSLLNIVLVNILGMLLALAVDSKIKSKNFLRTVFFSPNVLSLIIVGFLWRFMFASVLPELGDKLGIPFLQNDYFGNPDQIIYVIVFVALWQGCGIVMIIYLAGLQGIPVELKEAMYVDGASRLQQFFKLILPLMIPALISNIFITTTGSLKAFDLILALTNGGPANASESLAINIYREGFTSNAFGSGSAKAIMFCLMVLVITVIQVKYLNSKEV